MQAAVNTAMAQRLARLAQLYEQGQASPLMDQILNKLMAREADESRAQLEELETDLAEFETRYGMDSEDFYGRFQVGQTDDRMDFVEWASLMQMAANLRQRLQLLTGESVP